MKYAVAQCSNGVFSIVSEWTEKDKKICSYNVGILTGRKSGTTEVTATYEGTTYTCIVRVN